VGRRLAVALRHPTLWVLALVFTQILLWGVLSARFNPTPTTDSLEQVLLSQDLRLAYGKHPPLPTWILYGANQLFGASIGATFVLGALCSVTTLLLLYAWACPLVGARRAAVATLFASAIVYLNAATAYFNHNTVQLPLAMLTIVLFHRAILRNRLADWALLGAVCGLMMLAKASAVVLFASFAVYLLWTRRPCDAPTRRGLLAAAFVFAAVIAPHLIAAQSDPDANRYAMQMIFPPEVDRAGRLKSVWSFATSQLAKVAPALLIFAVVRRRAPKAAPAVGDPIPLGPFVTIVGFGPLVLTLIVAVLAGARLLASWGTSFHVLLTLWLVVVSPYAITVPRRVLVRAAITCIALQAVVWSAVMANGGTLPSPRRNWHHGALPPPQLAEVVQDAWTQRSSAPLRYVVSDIRIGALLAVQFRGRPRVIDGNRPDFAMIVPRGVRAACGFVVVAGRPPLTDPHDPQYGPLDALLNAAAPLLVTELQAHDGSRRNYFIGIQSPANANDCGVGSSQ
jgi:4-amino-4-deoxy-L-arabinose transferase-like glycosyltransferase